jgi:hypothetical protein
LAPALPEATSKRPCLPWSRVWNHRDDLGLMEQVGTHIHGGAVEGGND